MQKLINSLKHHWEEFATLFLLAFIPLYPKLPLFDVVQTWVYIRLDDFVVALVVVGFLFRHVRMRYFPDVPLSQSILFYWAVGAISTAYSLAFIGPRLLGYFPQLVFLHFLRRIEYMMMFFLAAVTIRNLALVKRYIFVFALTVFAVSLYGLGQRFMRLPAFLTMNEEFAKGIPLYLSPTSRIASTFAGHYDLAIYLAFAVTIFASVFFGIRSVAAKLGLLLVSAIATVTLLMTQSRVSLAALAIGIVCVFWWQNRKRWLVPIFVLGIIAIPFVPGISDRFGKTFRARSVIYDIRAGIPIGVARVENDGHVTIVASESPAKENLPIGSGFIRVPLGAAVPLIASFAVGELRKLPDYPFGAEKPSLGEELHMAMERNSVYLSTSKVMATSSGEIGSVSGRFFLDRAILYDISFTTRFQGTWPRAWEAFGRNFLLGSGYSVLSIASDSDYLRALGETGIAGLASFLFIPLAFFLFVRAASQTAQPLVRTFAVGTSAALVGLLLTAVLIDVFEASKVAYVTWLTLGATVGALGIRYKKKFPLWEETRKVLSHPLVFIGLLLLLVPIVYQGVTRFYFVADDFTWLAWAARSTLSDFSSFFTDAAGFFYRPLTKLYFFFASLVFWFKPEGYHAVNLILHFGVTALTYLVVRKLTKHQPMAILTALYFLVLAMHHENVVWISGVSSLAGSFFALLALNLWMNSSKHVWGIVSFLMSLVSLLLSMLWYEEMTLVPLILVVYSWLFWPKKYRVPTSLLLFFIPLYWWVRMNAQAIPPSGSYGINIRLLPLNAIGNMVGYIAMILVGPSAVSPYTALRESLRVSPVFSGTMLITVMVLLGVFLRKHLQRLMLLTLPIFFFLFALIALAPTLGLGNIAERYGYLASSALSFLFVWFVFWLYRKRGLIAWAIFAVSFGVNYYALKSTLNEWQQAGKRSEKILYEMRRKYYPLEPNTQFVVANVPTRLGRAWVFPVGLNDAAYLTFRDPTMKLDVVGSEKDALEVKRRNSDKTKALTIDDDKEYPVRELYE